MSDYENSKNGLSDGLDGGADTGADAKSLSDGQNAAQEGAEAPAQGKGRRQRKNAPKSDFEALQGIGSADSEPLKAYFENIRTGTRAGVWFYDVGTTKDGTEYYKPPVRLCDPLEIVGRGQGADEGEYRVIEYLRHGISGRSETKQAAFPLEIVGTREGWALLRGFGIGVNQNGATMAALANYLQWEGSAEQWQITERGGWTDDSFTAYVLPGGEIIGKTACKTIYIGDTSKKEAYAVAGDLAQWKEQIGRYIGGNSRPSLALGAVFAAPLLRILRLENGGFHIYGASGSGKTLSGLLAFSAIGNPDGLKVQWKGTSLGFDNEAAANNDGLIFLDEIGEGDPKTVKDVGYSVFNGTSKLQGKAAGGNRTRRTWRVLAVSTGEFDAEHYLKAAGYEWNAGQAVRLPAVPADAGKGYKAFDTLHGFADGAALVAHLEEAARSCYGAPFRAYLQRLADSMADNPEALKGRLKALQSEFCARLPAHMDSQPARVSKRFTMAAVGLALACEWDITGFDKETAFAGVLVCFNAWHEREGAGNREERQIIANARDFLTRDGYGERFADLRNFGEDGYKTERNHAGFRVAGNRHAGERDNPHGYSTFYITDEAFEAEICKGFERSFVCRVLAECGWLQTEKAGGGKTRNKKPLPAALARRFNIPGRFYTLVGEVPPAEWGEAGA